MMTTRRVALRDSRVWEAVGLLAMVAVFLCDVGKDVPQLDDAYISYRYAANLVAGKGLVFNAGEYVEGYTNLLWTLLVALLLRLGGEAPRIGLWLNAVSGALSLLAVHGFARSLLPPGRLAWALIAPLVLLASTSFAAWTTGGMETPLFLVLTVSACWAASLGRRWLAAVLCMLTTLTRPEGALLAACLLLHAPQRPRPGSRQFLNTQAPALVFGAFMAATTLWRLWYYGDLVPNTFHAKVGEAPWQGGLLYFVRFLLSGAILLVPPAAVAAWRLPALRPGLLFCVLNTIYDVSIGGDFFPQSRFFLAPFALLAVATSARAGTRVGGLVAGAAATGSILWSLFLVWPNLPVGFVPLSAALASPPRFASWQQGSLTSNRAEAERHYFPFPEDPFIKSQLAHFAQMSPPARVVAATGIGRLGYFGMDLRIVDLVGLVDKHIARSPRLVAGATLLPGHSRTDAPYVLSQLPDAIIIDRKGAVGFIHWPAMMDLWAQPELERDYVFDEGAKAYLRRGGK